MFVGDRGREKLGRSIVLNGIFTVWLNNNNTDKKFEKKCQIVKKFT